MSATAPTFVESPSRRTFLSNVRTWSRYRRELAGFVIDVLCVLINERATGRLSIDLTQGCAAQAEFVERADLSNELP
jgi:hypothetical protein